MAKVIKQHEKKSQIDPDKAEEISESRLHTCTKEAAGRCDSSSLKSNVRYVYIFCSPTPPSTVDRTQSLFCFLEKNSEIEHGESEFYIFHSTGD